jgi:hypothetical protein
MKRVMTYICIADGSHLAVVIILKLVSRQVGYVIYVTISRRNIL